jgi:Lrp/AsnC family transcriptional regulator, leucine-responsive regulatory protein
VLVQESTVVESLDAADRAILDLLRRNGRATVAELATASGLSASASSRRLRRLEDRRVIRGYRAIIDPKADGRGLTAFVAVRLVRHQREDIQRFQASAREVPEIIECHHVTGTFDYLLRVEVADLAAYENVHADRLAALHNVGQLVTYISMADFTEP